MLKFLEEEIWYRIKNLDLKFSFFTLYLNDISWGWGFYFFTISRNYTNYSLIGINFVFPKKQTPRRPILYNWDLLFLMTFFQKRFDKLFDDTTLYHRQLSKCQKIEYNILKKII